MTNDTTISDARTTDETTDTKAADNDLPTRSLRRAGISGLVASAAYLATGVLTSLVGGIEAPASVSDMDRYLREVGDAQLGFVLYAIAGIALCVLYVPMSRAVTELLRGRRAAKVGTASVIAGLVVLVPAYVIAAVSSVGLVNRGEAGTGADVLFDAYEIMATAAEICFGLGSLLSLGIGPLLWGLAGRAGHEIPRWISQLAIVVGVLGLVWAIPMSVQPAVVVLLNVLGSLVLFVALSRRLIHAG